jgi:putative ABC transport system substrate-binding protein
VAVLLNPDNPANELDWDNTRVAAGEFGVNLHRAEVRTPMDFEPAFEAARKWEANALLVFVAPLMIVYRRTIVSLAAKYRWPAMYGLPEFVEDGGLMAYGPRFPAMYRRAAVFVRALLLEGKTPSELPVDQSPEYELLFNRETAHALNAVVHSVLRFRFRAGGE